MPEQTHDHDPDVDRKMSRANWVFIVFLAIAGFYLITEHTAHLLGWLPLALLLLCPLMHMFMHGGHGAHGGRRHADKDPRPEPPAGAEPPSNSANTSPVRHQH